MADSEHLEVDRPPTDKGKYHFFSTCDFSIIPTPSPPPLFLNYRQPECSSTPPSSPRSSPNSSQYGGSADSSPTSSQSRRRAYSLHSPGIPRESGSSSETSPSPNPPIDHELIDFVEDSDADRLLRDDLTRKPFTEQKEIESGTSQMVTNMERFSIEEVIMRINIVTCGHYWDIKRACLCLSGILVSGVNTSTRSCP